MNRVYTQTVQGQRWLRRYRGHRPRLACVLGFTETGLVPGISAAGATPEDRRFTAIADAEKSCSSPSKTSSSLICLAQPSNRASISQTNMRGNCPMPCPSDFIRYRDHVKGQVPNVKCAAPHRNILITKESLICADANVLNKVRLAF